MATDNDMEDYEALLEPSFNPTSFANDLLVATNSTRNELDISTAIKRVRFDINNIDLQLDKISAEDHEALIRELHSDVTKKQLFAQLDSPMDHINTSYQRIEKDLSVPYNKAVKTQEVLKKIHTTSYLLRSVTYFLHLIQQITEIQSSPHFAQSVSNNSKALFKLANLHNQLKAHISENSSLKSLKIIRDYEPIGFEQQRQLRELINSQIKAINDKTLDTIPHPTLRITFQALYSIDPQAPVTTIATLLSNNVAISVNTLTRVLNSPRNISSALDEVFRKAQFISKLSIILGTTTVDTTKNLLLEIQQQLELNSLVSGFWRNVAKKLEPKFRETMQRGGPVAKSLISYKDQIRTLMKRAVMESDESFKSEGVEVKMMLNAVASLDRLR